jgi:hypothetical protein
MDFPGDPSPPGLDSAQPTTSRRVRDALRLAFFRAVPDERLAASWGAILVVALATVAIPILVSVWMVGLQGEWSWNALPYVLFHLPLILGAAIAAAYALGRREDVAPIAYAAMLIYLGVDLTVIVLWALAGTGAHAARIFQSVGVLPALWFALAFAVYAARRVERGVRRLAVVMLAFAVLALPLGTLYRERTLWHRPYVEDGAGRAARLGVATEDAFYRQPQLLASALEAVRPGRKGVIDVYFVGVAGFGGEDVFMREVDAVTRLFKERFGAEGHAISLVNNPKRVLDTPIASATSLRAALQRVGEAMDKDEDVLVLFLTSHGSPSHGFSLDLWPMAFKELDPATLRAALDESGIRNRVVIVSACYSGGFVEPLRNEDTLVITAAAADRNSFGCSNEADWTYFGKAYFDEALRKTYSFTQAFEAARPAIAARERRDGYEASNPQMALGGSIAPKLAALERQLARNAARSNALAGTAR